MTQSKHIDAALSALSSLFAVEEFAATSERVIDKNIQRLRAVIISGDDAEARDILSYFIECYPVADDAFIHNKAFVASLEAMRAAASKAGFLILDEDGDDYFDDDPCGEKKYFSDVATWAERFSHEQDDYEQDDYDY